MLYFNGNNFIKKIFKIYNDHNYSDGYIIIINGYNR